MNANPRAVSFFGRRAPRPRAKAHPLDCESLLQATGDEIVNMNHADDFFLSIKDRKH